MHDLGLRRREDVEITVVAVRARREAYTTLVCLLFGVNRTLMGHISRNVLVIWSVLVRQFQGVGNLISQ